jgi:hypothetical protein
MSGAHTIFDSRRANVDDDRVTLPAEAVPGKDGIPAAGMGAAVPAIRPTWPRGDR